MPKTNRSSTQKREETLKGTAKFNRDKRQLLLRNNQSIHSKVIDDLDTFLSGCQRNVLIVKKNYEELVKLSVYLQGEVDAERIKSLEKQEESLIKTIKCLSSNVKALKELNLNTNAMIVCPTLADETCPIVKGLVKLVFLREQLTKQITNYQEVQTIINSKTNGDGWLDQLSGKPEVVKGLEASLETNLAMLNSQLKACELQVNNFKKQLSTFAI